MKDLFGSIFSFSKMRDIYSSLKDTEKGDVSAVFGAKGVVYALMSGAMLVISYFAFRLTFENDWKVIIGFILLVIGASGSLLFFLYGIFSTLLQLKLNKKAIGFLSLFFQISAFAAAIAVLLVVNNVAIVV